MTSCVFTLFVVVCFSVSAVQPTGILFRITDKGLDTLKDVTVKFLEALINKPFAPAQLFGKHITGCHLRDLKLNSDQVSIVPLEGSVVKIDITDMMFDLKAFVDGKPLVYTGKAEKLSISFTLKRNQNHLAMEMKCSVSGVELTSDSSGLLWGATNVVNVAVKLRNSLICEFAEYYFPKLNQKLENVAMVTTVYTDLNINMDFSLAGRISSTPHSLDIPFRGLVFPENGNLPDGNPENNLEIPEDNHMAYVAASDSFFNSVSQTLYGVGALSINREVNSKCAMVVLKAIQIVKQPWDLLKPLYGSVGVTEAPSIKITADGMEITVKVKGDVSSETPTSDRPLVSMSISLTCQTKVQVYVAGSCVSFSDVAISCTAPESGTVVNGIISIASSKLKDFVYGLQIPLPFELGLSLSDIYYRDGYLVGGGSMWLGPDMMQEVVDGILKLTSNWFGDSTELQV